MSLGLVMRIFMEGQEEWLEPGGQAMMIIAKLFLAGAAIAIVWGTVVRFAGVSSYGPANLAARASNLNDSLNRSISGVSAGWQTVHTSRARNA